MKDKNEQKWYYEELSNILQEFKDTTEYQEYNEIYQEIFEGEG